MKSYNKPQMDIIEVELEGTVLDASLGIGTESVSASMMKAPGMGDWDDEE